MKIIAFILTLLFSPLTLSAQTTVDRINEIKLQTRYIYADLTLSQNKDDAYQTAMQQLQYKIEEWAIDHSRKKLHKDSVGLQTHLADTITMPRFGLIRIFAYVDKSQIIDSLSKRGIKISDPNALIETPAPVVAPQPVQEIKTAKPVEEMTLVPEPPVADNVKPAPKTPTITEELPATTPEPQEVTLNPPTLKDTTTVLPVLKAPIEIKQPKTSEVLSKILAVDDFFDLADVMKPLKRQGLIEYGRYTKDQDLQDCYLIVYNTNGKLPALLGPGGDNRMNLKEHRPDKLSNYAGCGALWFREKQSKDNDNETPNDHIKQ